MSVFSSDFTVKERIVLFVVLVVATVVANCIVFLLIS